MNNENKKKVNTSKNKNKTQKNIKNNKPAQKSGNNKNNNQTKKTNNAKKSINLKTNKQTQKNNTKKVENKKQVKEEVIVKEEIKENEVIEPKEEKLEIKENTKEEKKSEPIVEDKTNKTGLIVLLGILLIIVGICIFYQVNNKEKDTTSNYSTEESNEIMDNFYKYFNSKKTKVIYYASSTCGYCSLETPIMEQISKDYDMDFLHIDSSKLSNSDREKMLKELNIDHATPTTIIVKNGKIIDTQIGYIDGGKMVEFLKNGNVLDKDAVYTPEQYLTFINYEEYNNILKQSGKHIITIGQTGCSHCTNTKPVLNQIAKDYDLTINYLNITEMTKTENESFINSLEEIGYNDEEFVSSKNFGTPLTLIIENGKVTSYINGERPTAQFIRALKKAGVIAE